MMMTTSLNELTEYDLAQCAQHIWDANKLHCSKEYPKQNQSQRFKFCLPQKNNETDANLQVCSLFVIIFSTRIYMYIQPASLQKLFAVT